MSAPRAARGVSMLAVALPAVAIAAIAMAVGVALPLSAAEEDGSRTLRVCADPNNLPFSNDRGEGFENKIAELLAEDLGATLEYFWWPQRRGFVRNALKAGKCDLVVGVPAGYELVATTAPYYRSSYVYVYRRDRDLDISSIRDERLRDLRIGVHLIGDDGANTPPAHVLGQQGIVDNVVGYMIYGDYREQSPTAGPVEAVSQGAVDVAAVWGPIGGYFAGRSPVPLEVVRIADAEAFGSRPFTFAIAAGVRKEDEALLQRIDDSLSRQREPIRALLRRYGVPLEDDEPLDRRQ